MCVGFPVNLKSHSLKHVMAPHADHFWSLYLYPHRSEWEGDDTWDPSQGSTHSALWEFILSPNPSVALIYLFVVSTS